MAWFDESVAAAAALTQAGQIESLGDIPLIVFASSRPTHIRMDDGRDPQELWLELQDDLTGLSENGELRMRPGGGHYPQFDDSEGVIEAIQDVIQGCQVTH